MIVIRTIATIMIATIYIRRASIRAIIVLAHRSIAYVVHVHILAVVNIDVNVTPASVYVYIVVVDGIVTAVVIDVSIATVGVIGPVGAVIGVRSVGVGCSVLSRLRRRRLLS